MLVLFFTTYQTALLLFGLGLEKTENLSWAAWLGFS